MRSKFKRIGCGLVALLGILAIIFAAGEVALQKRIERLSAQAESLGMYLSREPAAANAKAEQLLSRLKSLDARNVLYDLGYDVDTEHLQELRKFKEVIAEQIALAYAVSEQESLGRDESDLYLDVFYVIDPLRIDGNLALANRDLSATLKAAAALRRIAHLMPRGDWIPLSIMNFLSQDYATLLQRAAEVFSKPEEIEAIIAEAAQWEIRDFRYAAANLIAVNHEAIDDDRYPRTNLKEALIDEYNRSQPVVARAKADALQYGIEVYVKWNNDSDVIRWSSDKTHGYIGLDVYHIKIEEMTLRTRFNALRAKLNAHQRVALGKPWPSIEELQQEGIFSNDLLQGRPFEWREFRGNRRIFGPNYDGRDYVDSFVILSYPDRAHLPK